jgi:hypothetical protein
MPTLGTHTRPLIRIVAVVLSPAAAPRLVEVYQSDYAEPYLTICGAKFKDSGAGDWLGFYDWLRTTEGKIVGVRQRIDEPSTFPFHERFQGVVESREGKEVCVFFGSAREFDEAESCDTDFGNNCLFTAGGDIALTFEVPSQGTLEIAAAA